MSPTLVPDTLKSRTKIAFVPGCSSATIKGLHSSFYSYAPNVKAAGGKVPVRPDCTRARSGLATACSRVLKKIIFWSSVYLSVRWKGRWDNLSNPS